MDSTERSLVRKIEQCQRVIESADRLLARGIVTPGWVVTGQANRSKSLGKRLQGEINRNSALFNRQQRAASQLAALSARLALYREGEIHANGQPRADAPSRQKKASVAETWAAFMKSVLKVGLPAAVAGNVSSTITVKRINKKTVTDNCGDSWGYDELWPCAASGIAMSVEEGRTAMKAFMEGQHA